MKGLFKKEQHADIAKLINSFNCRRLFNKQHLKAKILAEILQKSSGVILFTRQTAGDIFYDLFSTKNDFFDQRNAGRIALEDGCLKIERLHRSSFLVELVTNDHEVAIEGPPDRLWREIGRIPVEKIISLREAPMSGFCDIAITVSV